MESTFLRNPDACRMLARLLAPLWLLLAMASSPAGDGCLYGTGNALSEYAGLRHERLLCGNLSTAKGEIAEAVARQQLDRESGGNAQYAKCPNSPSSDLYVRDSDGVRTRPFNQVKAVRNPAVAVQEGLKDGLTFYGNKPFFREDALLRGNRHFDVLLPKDTYAGAVRSGYLTPEGQAVESQLLTAERRHQLIADNPGGENAARLRALQKQGEKELITLQKGVRFRSLDVANDALDDMARTAATAARTEAQAAAEGGTVARGVAQAAANGADDAARGIGYIVVKYGSTIARVAVPLGVAVQFGLAGYDIYCTENDFAAGRITPYERGRRHTNLAFATTGGIAGAIVGGAAGSAIAGPGGAIVGVIVGSVAGAWVGGQIGDAVWNAYYAEVEARWRVERAAMGHLARTCGPVTLSAQTYRHLGLPESWCQALEAAAPVR